jgi:hypothetical protein
MADLKISALTSATTPLAGTEVLPIVQSSTTVKVAVNDMLGTQSYTSPAVDSNGNVFLRATDTLGTGVGTQMMMGGKYNASAYVGFGGVAGRKENASSGNLAGYLDLLTCSSGGTIASRWRVDSAGNFNQRIAGIGVNFTANTPAAGMTSQLLNWYEDGTWTPNQGSGLTVVGAFTSSGTYTRVGRLVTVTGKLTGATSIACTAVGLLSSNLPFTSAATVISTGGLINASVTSSGITWVNPTSTEVYSASAVTATGSIYFSVGYHI